MIKTKQAHDPKRENQTENTDNHTKKKDNELKEINHELHNLRNDEHELDQQQSLHDGKNRIQPATQEQKEKHDEYEQKDKIPRTDTNLMTVIANHTIATLQTNTNIVPLVNAPLSSFAFGKVDRSINGYFGITPYVITTQVPQLFKFTPLYNAAQQVNLPDLLAMKFSLEEINATISKSIELFNISTMTVRIELNENIGHGTILDPNSIKDGALKLTTLIPAISRQNPQSSANFVENRIFSVLSAFNALDNILVAIPKKLVALDSVRGGPVAESLAIMPFYENMHPHPYYSVFSNLPDWARAYFNECFTVNPLQIGDLAVDSYAGMKLSQTTKLVLDQFTAAVLRMNYNKLKNHTLTTNTLENKIRASLFQYDKLEVETLCDLEDFSLLYDFSHDEYELYMFRILVDSSTRLKVINFLVSELEKTNRLCTLPIEDIWQGLLAGDLEASSFNSQWTGSISIGNSFSPYEMLIYETFSDFFTFNPTFSSTPKGIEAITEILSIYTFMILYPRITQRCIHKIGYRLTSLLDVMYPQIFNAFRHEFGDIRTNWGRDKFQAYDYQMSRTESQQGYIYSIFTPLTKVRNDRYAQGLDQSVLNRFIALMNSIRTLILPTQHQYSLDRKRIAHYPYLYTTYTTYASWAPIPYGDYQNSQQTELGNRLKLLIAKSEDFRSLYTAQTPASSQIPRGFNSYFISWTNQLARLLSTAGGVYQITCAMIQETLFNSPFYVGSLYTPNSSKFFYVPNDIGIAPLPSASLSSLVIPTHIQINNFKLNIGMALALTMEGEYMRNTVIPYENDNDITRPRYRQRTDMTSLDAVECFKMMNSLVSESRRFGCAMQMTQWLTTPDDPDNPFQSLMMEIAQYMKMASWVPLVKKIFAIFDVNYDEVFIRTMGPTEFILDGRYLDRSLVLVDSQTAMAQREQPLNSKFGTKFNYMTQIDIDKLEVLTKPLISMDSKIIYIHKDWYFGRLVVDEMGPTQTQLSFTNWTDETTLNREFIFRRVAYKNGQAASIQYRSDIDGHLKTMILPYVAQNAPVLLIKLEYTTELNLTYLRVLAKAIAHGKIILKIKYFKVRVWIEDMPSRTDDYSEPPMTEDEVYEVLSLPAGCIYEKKFKTTHYATNFSSEALVCPGYIQWFATPHEADRNIFTSTITNAIVRPSQTILPHSDELGYGLGDEGLHFPTGALKTESNIINWNNSIPTVSPKLINSVDLRIIPFIPQYLGNA